MSKLIWLAGLTVAVLTARGAETDKLKRDLDEIARVATVMVDGDLCQRIVSPRALAFMNRKNPRDPWADADNYDVDDAAFTRVKKTLIRLSRLVDYPVDVNLWMPLVGSPASAPARIQIVIRNRNELSQFWDWGKLYQDMFPEMRSVLDTGRRVAVERKSGFVSVLAPVRNSLGEIAGLVEVVARVIPDSRENVK